MHSDLRLEWCSHEAALFACRAWHYSRTIPAAKLVKVGAWEYGKFVGAVIFSRGNTPFIGTPFDLAQDEIAELTRVALGPHVAPTSRIVAVAVRLLLKQAPGLKAIVSYADPQQQHVGTIYQAMGWSYLGVTAREHLLRVNGRVRHPRSMSSRYGHRGLDWLRQHVDAAAERVMVPAKHKYVLPIDGQVRARMAPLVLPYPKRERSRENAAAPPRAEAGEIPSRSLHNLEAADV